MTVTDRVSVTVQTTMSSDDKSDEGGNMDDEDENGDAESPGRGTVTQFRHFHCGCCCI